MLAPMPAAASAPGTASAAAGGVERPGDGDRVGRRLAGHVAARRPPRALAAARNATDRALEGRARREPEHGLPPNTGRMVDGTGTMHRHNEWSLAVRVRGVVPGSSPTRCGWGRRTPAGVDLLRSGFVGRRAPPPGAEESGAPGGLRSRAARSPR